MIKNRSRLSEPGWVVRIGVITYVGFLVALPLVVLVGQGFSKGWEGFVTSLTHPTALAALNLSLWTASFTALVNGIVGTALAWALVRWEFRGRILLSMLVDLPLVIPTLVAGLLLLAVYGPTTPIGRWLNGIDFPIAFAQPGIVLALLLITLPLVVRAVQPVLEGLDPAEEEAAYTLGAPPRTVFFHIMLPPLLPAIAAGTVQTFARALAEFGSLVVISGNIPFKTLVMPVYILGQVEGGDLQGAAVTSLVLLALSVSLHGLARWIVHRFGSRGV